MSRKALHRSLVCDVIYICLADNVMRAVLGLLIDLCKIAAKEQRMSSTRFMYFS